MKMQAPAVAGSPETYWTYNRKTIALILSFAVLRIFMATVLELGNDEAYYWLFSRQLQWNYFDHPPMVAAWIRVFTLNGRLDGYEVFVRLGSVISCACSTWFIFKTTAHIKNDRAGWFAACLFNASLYTGVMAGILTMPDSPQLFFWTFTLWRMARVVDNESDWKEWILLGLSAGLCIMSKVHGMFLWSGMGLFVLFNRRQWLLRPQLYVALLLSVLVAIPILLWNMHYDFVTWRFHSERVEINAALKDKDSFWLESLGQVLVNNPVNSLLIVIALAASWRKGRHLPSPVILFNWIALPFVALVTFLSLFRDIWYYWSGPAFTTLLPLAAIHLARITRVSFPAWLKASTAFFLLFLFLWPLMVQYYPGTYSKDHKPGKNDITLDKFNWEEAGEQFAAFYHQQVSNNERPLPIVCPSWWGAHVEYYFARPAGTTVIALGEMNEIHHYAWLNEERERQAGLDTAYCISPSIENENVKEYYGTYYDHIDSVMTIKLFRSGKPAADFYVFRLWGWRGKKLVVAGENTIARSKDKFTDEN